ncbi:MAG: mannitol-1-phosphate 5-dehydrogenase [Clostridiaceae bacterium]
MKKAVMYGAGNIGRGFIGQLFSESGYEVAFIDVNQEIISCLNRDGKYPVGILSEAGCRETVVTNVRGVNGLDIGKVAETIAEADIMATAVGVNVLPKIAKPVAEGLKKRWQSGRMEPLNIIICENLLNADHYLAELIKRELDRDQINCFEKLVGLVEASIGRMVPVMTPELQEGNILRICVEEYRELPVDRDAFKGGIPQIRNMQPASPFAFYIQRKLFIHNMGHALTAYLGKLKGYSYIWEAIQDPVIELAVLKAMQDSARALSMEHGVKLETILDHVDDLISRFGNKLLGDTVNRVGNDVKRKLSPNDRLVGAASLCAAHGIDPANICLGIAAAMKFDSADRTLKGVADILEARGPEAVLEEICGLAKENAVYGQALELYGLLGDTGGIDKEIRRAGYLRRKQG